MASQSSHFYGNVKYNIKMQPLHDRDTVQINVRTYGTEKNTNKQYNSTFGHANLRKNTHVKQHGQYTKTSQQDYKFSYFCHIQEVPSN